MKKVSAFAVFHSKKKAADDHVAQRPPVGGGDTKNLVPLRRAHSSQSMERGGKQKEPGSASKGKRLLHALKPGTIRESIRMSGKKLQAPSLTSLNGDSPFPGLSQISLVGPKPDREEPVKARKKLLEAATSTPKATPVSRKSPKDRKTSKLTKETPLLNRKSLQTSTATLRLKSPKPSAVRSSQSLASEPLSAKSSNSDQTVKHEKRRKGSESSSTSARPKKRKTDIGDLVENTEKTDAQAPSEMPYMYDSTEEARKLFECMIHPVTPQRFFTYLTPPGTQGFAPHFDDIEAFILQLEGKKHWRLYSPRSDEEVLPRYSSGNFSQSEMKEPILDTVLEAGDLLYFPRGTIHQGDATDEHSLHITVSCYQLNTWGDLLMKLLPSAIEMAIEENPAFRAGLPRNFLNYMGIVHSEKDLPERTEFVGKLQTLIGSLMESLPVDAACDQMGKRLMHDSMPPVLSEVEKSCSVHAAGERWDPNYKKVVGVSELQPDTAIKLIRRGCLR
ncbi:bifunctional lysine-specific demethylase and histidyl-hydroxylase no66-like [Plakobranchus ocellatus]|uniref:Bifunctional lysine-specific demethylase and histidyl-hydroxylase n=1 Tax=Plakobranchus ocellatus TaxID=259542 RepID=A0AAV4CSM1_9GAST|nr:bifunctional lysine-specific demethylase and histidyl-hydroxylase no66-like [Plakobranchus ocellatus]